MPTYNRSLKLENQTLSESTTVNGSVVFMDLTIKGDLTVNGSTRGGALRCDNMTINGSLSGTEITVTHDAELNGKCIAGNVTVGNKLTVNGRSEGQNWKVINNTFIANGQIDFAQSHFQDIQLSSRDSGLENSKARNILVKKPSFNTEQPQILRLSKNTIIDNITFESGNGIIYADSSCKINSVRGGKIIIDPIQSQRNQITHYHGTTINGEPVNGLYINNREINLFTFRPRRLIFAALLIGCIVSFALSGPLWLGITLAVLCGLSLFKFSASYVHSKNTKKNTTQIESSGITSETTPKTTITPRQVVSHSQQNTLTNDNTTSTLSQASESSMGNTHTNKNQTKKLIK